MYFDINKKFKHISYEVLVCLLVTIKEPSLLQDFTQARIYLSCRHCYGNF
jgi:hypothetical protein